MASLSIFDSAQVCVEKVDSSGAEYVECTKYMRADTSLVYDGTQWASNCVLCVLGIGVYIMGIPVCFWVAVYWYGGPRRPTSHRDRVWLLIVSYRPGFEQFEVVECLRRLMLTSVILIVRAGTVIQIWFGMVISVIFIAVYRVRPYRDLSSHLVMMLCASYLTLMYLATCQFLSSYALTLTNIESGDEAADQWARSYRVVAIACVGVIVLVFIVAILSSGREKKGLSLVYVSDGNPVLLLPPLSHIDGYHGTFLSHALRSCPSVSKVACPCLTIPVLVSRCAVFVRCPRFPAASSHAPHIHVPYGR